jgi:lipopolysaccharide export system protein LptA
MKNRKRNNSAFRGVLAIILLAHVIPSWAEKADRDKPVNLAADTVTVDDAKQTSVYEGNVILTQGTLMIRADKLIVKQDAEGFDYGTAYGNPASFRQKREGVEDVIEGEGKRIEYDGKKDKVEFFNNARMKRGGDEVRGNYISYDAKAELFQVLGGPKETTAGGASGGRVHAVIQPKKTDGALVPVNPAFPLRPSGEIDPAHDPRN